MVESKGLQKLGEGHTEILKGIQESSEEQGTLGPLQGDFCNLHQTLTDTISKKIHKLLVTHTPCQVSYNYWH